MKKILFALLLVWSLGALAVELKISPDERILCLIGPPYNSNQRNATELELELLGRFANRGADIQTIGIIGRYPLSYSSHLLENFDQLILPRKPTLVIIQDGTSNLLFEQYRSQEYDFTLYPKKLKIFLKNLKEHKIRAIVTSPTPITIPRNLNQELKKQVEEVRKIAEENDAYFVDQFTESSKWQWTSGNGQVLIPAEEKKLMDIFLRQITFLPAGSTAKIDLIHQVANADGCSISDLKINDKEISFVLQNQASSGTVNLILDGLKSKNCKLYINDKFATNKSAEDLKKGVDLGDKLTSQIRSKILEDKILQAHQLSDELSAIYNFKIEAWAKPDDFEAQKNRAAQKVLDSLKSNTEVIRQALLPVPLKIKLIAE